MVLLLCLIFLMALALLGLSASSEAILQSQLSTNLRETERAKQSAMAALSWAENWLLQFDGGAPEPFATACHGLKNHLRGSITANPESEDISWWLTHGHEAGIDPLTGDRISNIAKESINPPYWVIETLHEIPPAEDGSTNLQAWYRILARGSGQTDTGVSVVESIVVRSWASNDGSGPPVKGTTDNCPGSEPEAKCGRASWRELR